jgi:four helix bundle protein
MLSEPSGVTALALFNFEQLEVYQLARAFKKRIYKLANLFPEEERFRLRLQMRKAALSMTNCIAEGHGRFTWKDRIHFTRESRGSLNELVDDINDAEDLEYAKSEHLLDLKTDADRVHQLMNGYIGYLQREARKGKAVKKEKITGK